MIVTRAPLRIPLGGGGTDYPSYYSKYGGYCLGFATDLYVYVVIHPTRDGKIHLKYSKNEVVDQASDLQNTVAGAALKFMGIKGGLEISTFSDVPEASGLGGSSAFCTALLLGLYQYLGLGISRQDLFWEAYEVERVLARQSGGIQDQWFATYGNAYALSMGPGDLKRLGVEKLDLGDFIKSLRLVYTGKCRYNLDIASRQESETSKQSSKMLLGLGKVKAIGYTIREYLRDGNYLGIGNLFSKHWIQKIERDPAITTREVDNLYNKVMGEGALGGKLIGLGGGGYLLVCTERDLDLVECISLGLDVGGAKVIYSNTREVAYA